MNSSTRAGGTNKKKPERAVGATPCDCCRALFLGQPAGTIPAAEDDTCYYILPSALNTGTLLYRHPNVNNGLPYWETPANIWGGFSPAPQQAVMRKTKKRKR